jgi:hypothetical protein
MIGLKCCVIIPRSSQRPEILADPSYDAAYVSRSSGPLAAVAAAAAKEKPGSKDRVQEAAGCRPLP